MLWDGTYGFSSLSEKTRKSNHLQMSLQRQHFLLSLIIKDPECWSGRDLNPRPPAQQTDALVTELTRLRRNHSFASFVLLVYSNVLIFLLLSNKNSNWILKEQNRIYPRPDHLTLIVSEVLFECIAHKYRALDSETRTTTSRRFSQYWVLLTCEPATLWRENVIAVVILLRVSARMSSWREQVKFIKSKQFYHFAIWRGFNLQYK